MMETPAQQKARLGPLFYSGLPSGQRTRPEPIPPRPVNQPHSAMYLDRKYIETLEQTQQLNLCCRHVEESGHTAQWLATPTAEVRESGETVPDILLIICGKCSRKHWRFMVGQGDVRRVTEVR